MSPGCPGAFGGFRDPGGAAKGRTQQQQQEAEPNSSSSSKQNPAAAAAAAAAAGVGALATRAEAKNGRTFWDVFFRMILRMGMDVLIDFE